MGDEQKELTRASALDSKRRIAMLSVSDGFTFSNFLADALAIFLFVVWLWLLITVTNDLFRRHDISGWGKAAWVIALILFSYLAIFVYLISQGKSMAQRNAEQAKEARAELRQAVGFSVADEIAKLDALKASGSISADEFSRLRAKLVQ
jgi:cbb3-type cytochrome oxidase subunit 3